MKLGLDFDAGKSNMRAIGEMGPKRQLAGPKKSNFLGGAAHPFQWPSEWIFYHQNHKVQAPYKTALCTE